MIVTQKSISDRVSDRVDGRREGPFQNMPALPVDVLAPGPQGAHVDQRPRGADEHGGEVAAEDGLRPGRRCISVRKNFLAIMLLVGQKKMSRLLYPAFGLRGGGKFTKPRTHFSVHN